MGVGLAVLAYPIVNILYPRSHAAGPGLLSIMGIASFFVCIVLMENAILQASGKEKLPMIALISGSLLKIAVNWVIIAIPAINIYGAPIGTLLGYLCMAVIDYVFIRTALHQNPNLFHAFGKPVICSAVMGVFAYAAYHGMMALLPLHGKMHMFVCMVLAILIAAAVYVAAVIKTRCITADDMKLIPGGEKVARLLHMT
jgi:stage V sporulation protein B